MTRVTDLFAHAEINAWLSNVEHGLTGRNIQEQRGAGIRYKDRLVKTCLGIMAIGSMMILGTGMFLSSPFGHRISELGGLVETVEGLIMVVMLFDQAYTLGRVEGALRWLERLQGEYSGLANRSDTEDVAGE